MRKRKRKNHKKKYQQTDRVKEKKENQSLRQNKDTRREKNRKTTIYQKYVFRGDKKINKIKKLKIKK